MIHWLTLDGTSFQCTSQAHTHSHHGPIYRILSTCMFLDSPIKPQNTKATHANTGTTCETPHRPVELRMITRVPGATTQQHYPPRRRAAITNTQITSSSDFLWENCTLLVCLLSHENQWFIQSKLENPGEPSLALAVPIVVLCLICATR